MFKEELCYVLKFCSEIVTNIHHLVFGARLSELYLGLCVSFTIPKRF